MKTKILITGASGFVGSSFCLRHVSRDDLEIRGLGRRKSDLPGYMRADLTRPLELNWTPDLVIHAAARSSPWGSLEEFRRQNVLATRHVLDFCTMRGVRKLVFVSSSSVFYRDEDQFDITEETPIGPDYVNHYARTKHEAEKLVHGYAGDWCIVRPRAVFGPRDTVLFPRILRAAAEGRMISISRPGPPAVGDLIYIDTLSDYLLRAALDSAVTGEINLTNHEPVVMGSLLSELFERLGLPPVGRTVPLAKAMRVAGIIEWAYRLFAPSKEPPITRYGVGVLAFSKTFDAGKCRRLLGPPSVTLREGIERFIEWELAQRRG
jgi:nucleoside-diphosphate-sugar epimerase